jgi:hypothetical protein
LSERSGKTVNGTLAQPFFAAPEKTISAYKSKRYNERNI